MLAAVAALLSAIGASPALAAMTVTDAAFGNVVVGHTSTQTVTVSNDVTIHASSISISGTNASDFAIGLENCTSGSHFTCTFEVLFTPSGRGPRSAVATVTSDAVGGDNTSSLSGTGVAPVIQLPSSLSFGNQQTGTSSATKTLLITNTSTDTGAGGTLAITGISVTGSNASDFAISNDTCSSADIPPNFGSCSLKVSFSPSATGARSASVSVTSNAPPDYLDEVPLSGTGTTPALSLTPAGVAFADQQVGSSSATQSLTITSTGSAPLVVDALTVTGADYSVVSNTCSPLPVSLQPGETCTLGLRFSPTDVGARAGNVHVSTNAGTQDAVLGGSGTAAPTPSTTTTDGGGTNTPPPSGDTPPATSTAPTAVGCVVPALKGKTLAAARRALRRAHCELGKVTKVRAERGRGRVLRQAKRAGRRLPARTRIAVVVGRR